MSFDICDPTSSVSVVILKNYCKYSSIAEKNIKKAAKVNYLNCWVHIAETCETTFLFLIDFS